MGAPTVTTELLAGSASGVSASCRLTPARVLGRVAVPEVNDVQQPSSGAQGAAARGPHRPNWVGVAAEMLGGPHTEGARPTARYCHALRTNERRRV
jgi:hypothetical protein